MIDVDDGKLTVRVQGDEVQFNVFKAMKHPKDKGGVFSSKIFLPGVILPENYRFLLVITGLLLNVGLV